MKIYLKSGKMIRVSRSVGTKLMEQMLDDTTEFVTKRQIINKELVQIYRIDQVVVVK